MSDIPHQVYPKTGPRFVFNSPTARLRSYRNYVALGNALAAGVDSSTFFGERPVADYGLHAKIFEWCGTTAARASSCGSRSIVNAGIGGA